MGSRSAVAASRDLCKWPSLRCSLQWYCYHCAVPTLLLALGQPQHCRHGNCMLCQQHLHYHSKLFQFRMCCCCCLQVHNVRNWCDSRGGSSPAGWVNSRPNWPAQRPCLWTAAGWWGLPGLCYGVREHQPDSAGWHWQAWQLRSVLRDDTPPFPPPPTPLPWDGPTDCCGHMLAHS